MIQSGSSESPPQLEGTLLCDSPTFLGKEGPKSSARGLRVFRLLIKISTPLIAQQTNGTRENGVFDSYCLQYLAVTST